VSLNPVKIITKIYSASASHTSRRSTDSLELIACPNETQLVPYRLLRNIINRYCSPAFSLSVTYCQRLCILGHYGAIKIGLLLLLFLYPR